MQIKKIIFLLRLFRIVLVINIFKAKCKFSKFKTHSAKLTLLPVEQNRVAFMGNSISNGWGSRPSFFEGKPWMNLSGSGQCTSNIFLIYRTDVINLKPKSVISLEVPIILQKMVVLFNLNFP